MYESLAFALRDCPLVFSRPKIHGDKSVWLEYDPNDPNWPVIEFQDTELTYGELEACGFAESLVKKYHLDMPLLDSRVTASFDSPLLLFKASYLGDGGVALFSMRNHILLDGNSAFSFISHWAKCHRALSDTSSQPAIEAMPMALIGETDCAPFSSLTEISMDATRSPGDIAASRLRVLGPGDKCEWVFRIDMADLRRMKQDVMGRGTLFNEGEWVSSNNVLAAFIAQCVGRASIKGNAYEEGPWIVSLALDMRHKLGLPLRGLGTPIHFTEHRLSNAELVDPAELPLLAKSLRQSIDRCSREYLQKAMAWIDVSYRQMCRVGEEPWNRFWLTAMDANLRSISVSCMDKIPIYDADFGDGCPGMARSIGVRLNDIIAFLAPHLPGTTHDSLHLHVSLERPVMEALVDDPEWSKICTLLSAS
ncbi:hypothetical protein GGF46_005487 [Coemansia sp. RSA 552]|nr:hypothetical protein GGF46_005487 [Coemansia sp. RSA 552]